MFCSSPELPQKSIQTMQDDKFFSRLLSKESSISNPSFRVYYGGASGAVPFVWESQPGTPKYTFSESSLPPLTPPPSYYINTYKKPVKKHSRSNLLQTLFLKINLKKTIVSSSTSSLSSSSRSSSVSSRSVPPSLRNYRESRQFSTPGSSFDSRADEEEDDLSSPTSTLCFGIRRAISEGRGFRSFNRNLRLKRDIYSATCRHLQERQSLPLSKLSAAFQY
ncbi:Alkylated DNA repair protein [Quillaja saponaria]|uniref:Alkylated DNA repair protein n=1 Tax=Quillaja saponaria TaxID=32244 RepID=A0AAD7LN35_QUISA|nr:Alkylated DNA repair protein [Quillaja saponaria]